MRVGAQRHAPENIRYSLESGFGVPQGRFGRVQKISSHQDLIPGPSIPIMLLYRRYPSSIYHSIFVYIKHSYVLNDVVVKSDCITSKEGFTVKIKFKNIWKKAVIMYVAF
jgi:hypothetical protein